MKLECICSWYFPILHYTTLRNTNLQRKKSFEKAAFVEICISVTANVSKLKACVRPHVNVRWTFISSSRALFLETLKKRNIYGIIRIRRTFTLFKNKVLKSLKIYRLRGCTEQHMKSFSLAQAAQNDAYHYQRKSSANIFPSNRSPNSPLFYLKQSANKGYFE